MKQTLNARRAIALVLAWGAATAACAGGCTISSTGMSFGPYQPLTFAGKLTSTDRTTDATVSIVCSGIVNGGSYSVALGPSSVGNSMSPRLLANDHGGANMQFNIYRDTGYSIVWGDGIAGGAVIAGAIPTGDSTQSFAVYGKAPAGQNSLGAGNYGATMFMTVTYNP
jgi:spore coat protein U-like protein